MPWLYLLIAAVCEIVWAVGLKYTHGFTRLGPSILTWTAMVLSMVLLARAVQTLPIGTAYAVWTGIGAAGTAIFGIIILNESRDLLRIASIALILIGVVGLKLTTK